MISRPVPARSLSQLGHRSQESHADRSDIVLPGPDRLGDPAEFGVTCAFLCSAHAGYITGQSILIDGGAAPVTL